MGVDRHAGTLTMHRSARELVRLCAVAALAVSSAAANGQSYRPSQSTPSYQTVSPSPSYQTSPAPRVQPAPQVQPPAPAPAARAPQTGADLVRNSATCMNDKNTLPPDTAIGGCNNVIHDTTSNLAN